MNLNDIPDGTMKFYRDKLHRCPFCWGNNIGIKIQAVDFVNKFDATVFCCKCGAEISRQGVNAIRLLSDILTAWNTRQGELNVTMEEKYGRSKRTSD